MNRIIFIQKSFRLLWKHQSGKLLLIFLLTLFLGINSGFSIVLLIPLLQLLSVGTDAPAEGLALFFQNLSVKTGIPLTIETVMLAYVVLLTFTALLQYWKTILDARYQQTFIYDIRRQFRRRLLQNRLHGSDNLMQ